MKSFDTIFVLTRGGPGGGTTTLNYFIYQEAFETFNLGRASAAAYVLLIITLAVVLIPSISRYVVKIFQEINEKNLLLKNFLSMYLHL